MDIEETKEAIRVMRAFVDGKPIEYKRKGTMDFFSVATTPEWGWDDRTYRILDEHKPKPKPATLESIAKTMGTVVRCKLTCCYSDNRIISKGVNVSIEHLCISGIFSPMWWDCYFENLDGSPLNGWEETK